MKLLDRNLMTSVSDLKRSPRDVIEQAKKAGSGVYVLNRNKPEAVVLTVADYERLVTQVEELSDQLDAELVKERIAHTKPGDLLTDEQVRGKVPLEPVDPDDGWE